MRFNNNPAQGQAVMSKLIQHQMASVKKSEGYSFAMIIPYLQGLLLYGLSIAFPFFALMLIVPGKAGAFITWMTLWAWVKSWDVGWALVAVIDDMLWNMKKPLCNIVKVCIRPLAMSKMRCQHELN